MSIADGVTVSSVLHERASQANRDPLGEQHKTIEILKRTGLRNVQLELGDAAGQETQGRYPGRASWSFRMPRPAANVYPAASGGSNAAKLARVCRQREKAEADRQAAEVRRRCVASLKDGVSKECRTSCTDASKQRRCSVQREICEEQTAGIAGGLSGECALKQDQCLAEAGQSASTLGACASKCENQAYDKQCPSAQLLGRAFAGAVVCRRRRAMYRRLRSSCFLLSSLVAFGACSTVRHSELRRGPLVRKVQVDERVEDRDAVTVVEGGVAQVWVKRKTCTISSLEYAQTEHQDITHAPYGATIASGVVAIAGVATLGLGVAKTRGDTQTALGLAGTAGMIGGVILALYHAIANEDSDTRDLPSDKLATEEQEECRDAKVARVGSLPWRIRDRRRRAQDRPDGGGRQAAADGGGPGGPRRNADPAAPEAARGAGRRAPPRARRIFSRQDPARPVVHREDVARHPAGRPLGGRFGNSLQPEKRLRWDACRAVHTSLGRAAKCLDKGDGERVQESEGLLTRADGGDYATVFSFRTESRFRLTYRLLVPAPNADWLVQIVESSERNGPRPGLLDFVAGGSHSGCLPCLRVRHRPERREAGEVPFEPHDGGDQMTIKPHAVSRGLVAGVIALGAMAVSPARADEQNQWLVCAVFEGVPDGAVYVSDVIKLPPLSEVPVIEVVYADAFEAHVRRKYLSSDKALHNQGCQNHDTQSAAEESRKKISIACEETATEASAYDLRFVDAGRQRARGVAEHLRSRHGRSRHPAHRRPRRLRLLCPGRWTDAGADQGDLLRDHAASVEARRGRVQGLRRSKVAARDSRTRCTTGWRVP